MRVGNYSVHILGGRERSSNHVEIDHGSQYSISISNHGYRRCDAEVWIDGDHVDTFRLDPHRTTNVQGPTKGDRGRFTAFARDSADGQAAGLDSVPSENLGLIQVVFKPEKGGRPVQSPFRRKLVDFNCPEYDGLYRKGLDGNLRATFSSVAPRGSAVTMCSAPRGEAAGTGLTGRTDQKWYQADEIDHDCGNEVTISLRLVAVVSHQPDAVRPLRSKGCDGNCGCNCRRKSNPVPAPVS